MKRKLIKRFFGPERILIWVCALDLTAAKFNPFSKGLTLRKLKEAPHGIDLGPLGSLLT